MISILFTSQVILLAVGFGIGYLLLIKANTHEAKLKTIGEALAWVLIAMTVLLAICNFFYSITAASDYAGRKYCPVSSTSETQQQAIQEQNEQGMPDEDQGQPIKRNMSDHE